MIGWLKSNSINNPIVDIHSHLIPGIDDGAKSVTSAVDMILELKDLGYNKAVTTPHIHPNYPNTPGIIREKFILVQNELKAKSINFEVEVAAEYFVDEVFLELLKSDKEILSFGDKYVLVESSFINKPLIFESCLVELKSRGYHPILAHPERYKFLEGSLEWLLHLKEMNILFQVTISSFIGYYGPDAKEIAKRLLKRNMIDFLGSDLHHTSQIRYIKEGLAKKEIKKLCVSLTLKNNSLF